MLQDGFLSALPYLLLWFVQMFSGYFADYLRSKGHLSTVATRKIFNTIGIFTFLSANFGYFNFESVNYITMWLIIYQSRTVHFDYE